MSVWTGDAVPVRRSSRRLSVTAADVELIKSELATPVKETPRKLLHPKSSMIPRLKQIEEKMVSSDDDVLFIPVTESAVKKGRGRPRKDSPGRKMTAIKTPAPLKEEAAATSLSAARMKREEKTPPRSRSSSRSRKTQLQLLSGAAATTPTKQPPKLQQMPAVQPKIQAVLNFDDSPVITRRSIRIASKSPARNGHANGSGVQEIKDGRATIGMPVVARETTEQWRDKFTEEHPIFTKKFIPAMICLVYAMLFIVPCYYFDLHKKAPVWLDMAAQSISDMYDNFMAKRAASSAASAAAAAADSI